jgi:hypothetical protein
VTLSEPPAESKVRPVAGAAPIQLPVGTTGLTVQLRRLPLGSRSGSDVRPERSVVLIPGANSSCDTYLIPHKGFAGYLVEQRGWDVWLLDWRPSPLVIATLGKTPLGGTAEAERRAFVLDRAVDEDIPAALAYIRAQIGDRPLSVMGHCVGGGGLAMAIARGHLQNFHVDRIVLSTLGLFYEVPWNTWIKAEDYLLERMFLPPDGPRGDRRGADCRFIDPHDSSGWPQTFKDAYKRWPPEWLPGGGDTFDTMLRQLSFMVGCPLARKKLDPSINGAPVSRVFGPIHAGLYTHLGQMVRRGYAAKYNELDQIDRARLYLGDSDVKAPRGDLNREHFLEHDVALVAAGDNGVWHRDSIDLMYEWLRRSRHARCEKHVFAGYNIQELFWGEDARKTTYELFADSLGPPVTAPALKPVSIVPRPAA